MCAVPCTVEISQTYGRCFIQAYRQASAVSMLFTRHFATRHQSAMPPFWCHLNMAAPAFIHPPPLVFPTKMVIFTSYSTYNKTISYTQDMSYERSKWYLSNNWSVQERIRQHCPEEKSVNADMHKEQTSWENTKMVATLRSLCYCPLKANTGVGHWQHYSIVKSHNFPDV